MGVAEMVEVEDAQTPFFSVLMCCNRDDGYLNQAIESVLAQNFSSFEFIIVLNRCTDELYDSVAAIKDPRIVLFRTEIGQLSFNLNFGVNSAIGTYIVRFDSDDICHVDRLAESYKIIQKDLDTDIVAGSCRVIDALGNVVGVRVLREEDWRSKITYSNPFIHPAMVIRRDLILSARGYLGGFQSEDYDLWIRLAKRADVKCVFTSFPMIDYRISDFQSKGSRQAYAEVASYFFREFLIEPGFKKLVSVFFSVFKVFFKSKK
ncbi:MULTISPECIES: glycosyltransferase [unclassified Pseudomonas]|jgi:glycosyltransferase involved in cell wall biosynthesis|nr:MULTISPECIES: glycosyltransferase [unclassified Pseudomonas]